MTKERILLLVALGIIFLLAFWNVENRESVEAYRLEKERDKVRLEKNDKLIRNLLDSLAKQDLAALKTIQEEKIRADRAEEAETKAIRKYESIVFRASRSDRERDSVLRAVLHP